MAEQENKLYFGDNLDVLREHIGDETVDLIYLDPPFNSKATYNILFKEGGGNGQAQVKAFGDTWHWGREAERTYTELMEGAGGAKVADMTESLCGFLGKNDVTAYLVMMAIRLVELRRVLKETGSLYLHCDPTASHYLKIILDVIFGKKNFRNEIVWHYETGGVGKQWYARKHDVLFFYTKSDDYIFFPSEAMIPRTEEVLRRLATGNPGATRSVGETKYPMDVWGDCKPLNAMSKERLGYPTQKPLSLLKRIVAVSSLEGHVVLDPFCGCGTALVAAQVLERKFVGIDITHFAIGLIEKRLLSVTKTVPEVVGAPQAYGDALDLFQRDAWQFEAWAVSRLPHILPKERKTLKGSDGGVDGVGRIALEDGSYAKVLVQVKGGKKLGVAMVREFIGTLEREGASAGIFVVRSMEGVTAEMMREAAAAGIFKAKRRGGLLEVEADRVEIWAVEDFFRDRLPKICVQF